MCRDAAIYIDFGDAPDSYGTTLADDGPRHEMIGYDPATNTSPLMLGDSVAREFDGIGTVEEPKRFYPRKTLASHVLFR